MRGRLRDHGLSLTMLGLFVLFLTGQIVAGYRDHSNDQRQHGEAAIGYGAYLRSGHFIEATFENWESEFLQMGAYVLLTAFLVQRGSAESKDPDKVAPQDADPRAAAGQADAPWPVRRGGLALALYQQSLTIALLLLFAASFGLHALGGAREYSQEAVAHGGQVVSVIEFVRTARFWFESFQNWQSEFLSIAVLAILSIFLRQRGSPQSKPVAAPHGKTGTS